VLRLIIQRHVDTNIFKVRYFVVITK